MSQNDSDAPVEEPEESPEEPPPILGTWNRLYAVVLINLVVLIILLIWLTATAR